MNISKYNLNNLVINTKTSAFIFAICVSGRRYSKAKRNRIPRFMHKCSTYGSFPDPACSRGWKGLFYEPEPDSSHCRYNQLHSSYLISRGRHGSSGYFALSKSHGEGRALYSTNVIFLFTTYIHLLLMWKVNQFYSIKTEQNV